MEVMIWLANAHSYQGYSTAWWQFRPIRNNPREFLNTIRSDTVLLLWELLGISHGSGISIWDSNLTMMTRWRRDATKTKKNGYICTLPILFSSPRTKAIGRIEGQRKKYQRNVINVTKRSLHFSWRSPLRKTYWSLSSNYQRSDLSSHENDLGNAALGGEISLF